jgi:hypothetical protein
MKTLASAFGFEAADVKVLSHRGRFWLLDSSALPSPSPQRASVASVMLGRAHLVAATGCVKLLE